MSTSTKLPEAPAPHRQEGMKTSTKWIIAILAFFALLALAAALGVLSLFPIERQVTGDPGPVVTEDPGPVVTDDPDPVVGEAPIPDGDWFGFVTVGQDESGRITLGVDLAEMLTGQAAHDAAVDAGIITADEDLPNDFFIDNGESVLELMHLSDDAIISVVSSADVSSHLVIDADDLAALYDGTYSGSDVYGVAAGQPIAMELTVHAGEITAATAIYLP